MPIATWFWWLAPPLFLLVATVVVFILSGDGHGGDTRASRGDDEISADGVR